MDVDTATSPADTPGTAPAPLAPAPQAPTSGSGRDDFWDLEDPEDENGMIVVPAQQRFLESVLATLPKRQKSKGTVGDWPKGKGLLFEPPEPGLDGSPVTVESMCLVGVMPWAPTLMYKEEACHLSDKGQAPCPLCGFNSKTTHQGWSDPGYVPALLLVMSRPLL